MAEAFLPLHKLQERVLKLRSRVSDLRTHNLKSPQLRPNSTGDLIDRSLLLQDRIKHWTVAADGQTAASGVHSVLGPPPLKKTEKSTTQHSLQQDNTRLRTILRENLQEQEKIAQSVDQLRTELLARSQKIAKLEHQLREISVFKAATLPEMETALMTKDVEIEKLKAALTSSEAAVTRVHKTVEDKGVVVEERTLVNRKLKTERIGICRYEYGKEDLEKAVATVLARVHKSVASGFVTVAETGTNTRRKGFLCLTLRHAELYEEPDDEAPKTKLHLKACTVTVNTETLELSFDDGDETIVVLNEGKPEKLEKWLVALRGLRKELEYLGN